MAAPESIQCSGPRRTGGELGCEQREMGAGEDDGVDALAAGLVEQTGEARA